MLDKRSTARQHANVPRSLDKIYLHTVFTSEPPRPLIIMPAPPRLHRYLVRS